MIVISHRGYWKTPEEKNLEVAFRRSFDLGFGTETDIRDSLRNGQIELVISHDCPAGGEITLDEVLTLWKAARAKAGKPMPLALNIKADGLAERLKKKLETHGVEEYFIFDMSFPDLTVDAPSGLRCYTRLSEHESFPPLYYTHPGVKGIWLDAYRSRWYDEKYVRRMLEDGKEVAIVSPDVHKRMGEFRPILEWLVETKLNREPNLTICTDRPEEAAAVVL